MPAIDSFLSILAAAILQTFVSRKHLDKLVKIQYLVLVAACYTSWNLEPVVTDIHNNH